MKTELNEIEIVRLIQLLTGKDKITLLTMPAGKTDNGLTYPAAFYFSDERGNMTSFTVDEKGDR